MLISSLLVLQAVLWLLAPKLIREGQIKLTMSILLLIIMFQFLPKVYHSLRLMRKMTKVTGFIFGTIWWGFTINLIAYLIFSHVSENSYRQPRILQQQHELSSRFNVLQVTGGCWYALATQRVVSCLQQQCERSKHCGDLSLYCSKIGVASRSPTAIRKSPCLDSDGPFNYGIYAAALPVISSNSLADTILYPIFWGLLNLR